jgi:hypothetical protein
VAEKYSNTPEARARKRVEDLSSLLCHIGIFEVVNTFLWVQDFVIGGALEHAIRPRSRGQWVWRFMYWPTSWLRAVRKAGPMRGSMRRNASSRITDQTEQRWLAPMCCSSNLARYRTGEPLMNVIDKRPGNPASH